MLKPTERTIKRLFKTDIPLCNDLTVLVGEAIGILVSSVSEGINLAIGSFDKRLPDLAKMRNIGEHVDDYAVDAPKRRYTDVDRRQLHVGTWYGRGYRWIGELDVDVAKDAARQLLSDVREAVRGFDGKVNRSTD